MFSLTPEMLLKAYCAGIFPMADSRESGEIYLCHPETRGVLPIERFHVSRTLQRHIKKSPYQVTFDKAFEKVIHACADTRETTWINDEIIELCTQLHRMGYAHSVEAWEGKELVGGVYGVCIGGAFFAESMFSTKTNASSIALVHLVARLWTQGFALLDAQFVNEHLKQFGIEEIPREEYEARLEKALGMSVDFYSSMAGEVDAPSSSSSGEASVVNSSSDSEVLSFLQAMTHTS